MIINHLQIFDVILSSCSGTNGNIYADPSPKWWNICNENIIILLLPFIKNLTIKYLPEVLVLTFPTLILLRTAGVLYPPNKSPALY